MTRLFAFLLAAPLTGCDEKETADADGDGFGAGEWAFEGCSGMEGYAANNDDCDDTDLMVHPDATEVCDELDVDENCNGTSDNDDVTAADAGKSNFYLDADYDTYTVAAATRFCDIVPTYRAAVSAQLDCNDAASAINPGEAVEEKVSLSDRFGLWLGFHPCSQDQYLAMIRGYCTHFNLDIGDALLRAEAIEWQATRGARSGRVAWQFFIDLAGRSGVQIQ